MKTSASSAALLAARELGPHPHAWDRSLRCLWRHPVVFLSARFWRPGVSSCPAVILSSFPALPLSDSSLRSSVRFPLGIRLPPLRRTSALLSGSGPFGSPRAASLSCCLAASLRSSWVSGAESFGGFLAGTSSCLKAVTLFSVETFGSVTLQASLR